MSQVWLRLRIVALALVLGVANLSAAGGERIVIVADSRGLSGWRAWWTNLYNDSHLYFALLTILIIPITGLVLGKLTGWLLARTGINLRARELAEH